MPLKTLGLGPRARLDRGMAAAGFRPFRHVRAAAAGGHFRAVARGDAAGGAGAGAARPDPFLRWRRCATRICWPCWRRSIWRRRWRGSSARGPGMTRQAPRSAVNLAAVGMMIVATGLALARDVRPSPANTPAAAVAGADLAKAGPVLNDYSFGGYLIFAGIPTFIDGRGELFGGPFIVRYNRDVSLADLRDFLALLDQYKIRRDAARAGHAGGGAARPPAGLAARLQRRGGGGAQAAGRCRRNSSGGAESRVLRAERHVAQGAFDAARGLRLPGQQQEIARVDLAQARTPPSISAPCRRRAARASRSNSQRATASRVSGLSGLCSMTQTSPPGRTTRRISPMKCVHSAGATWCSTQIAVTRSKPRIVEGKAPAVEGAVVDVGVVGARLRDAGRGNVDAAQAADHAAQQRMKAADAAADVEHRGLFRSSRRAINSRSRSALARMKKLCGRPEKSIEDCTTSR